MTRGSIYTSRPTDSREEMVQGALAIVRREMADVRRRYLTEWIEMGLDDDEVEAFVSGFDEQAAEALAVHEARMREELATFAAETAEVDPSIPIIVTIDYEAPRRTH
jgi:hypothetical protein